MASGGGGGGEGGGRVSKQYLRHRSDSALRTGTKGNKGYDGSVIGMTVKINKENGCNGENLCCGLALVSRRIRI